MAIQQTERVLSARGRYRIPEERIQAASSLIQNGDIIAATSTAAGLDVAHTGLALWQEGSLHLLHAPLFGESVQVSRLPLAERILRTEGQDGIQVARPLDPQRREGAAP
jgi:molybdenum cofactor biosynthesis enzyme